MMSSKEQVVQTNNNTCNHVIFLADLAVQDIIIIAIVCGGFISVVLVISIGIIIGRHRSHSKGIYNNMHICMYKCTQCMVIIIAIIK